MKAAGESFQFHSSAFTIHRFLTTSVRQHPVYTLKVGVRDERINIEVALTFVCFLGQNVARMTMTALYFAVCGRAKALRRAFMRF